jgi:hypothetical protein
MIDLRTHELERQKAYRALLCQLEKRRTFNGVLVLVAVILTIATATLLPAMLVIAILSYSLLRERRLKKSSRTTELVPMPSERRARGMASNRLRNRLGRRLVRSHTRR